MNKLLISMLALFWATLSTVTSAQDLLLSTNVSFSTFHDDQYDLQVEGSETEGLIYSPNIGLKYETQRYQSTANFSAIYNQFQGSELEDSTNFNIDWRQQRTYESSVLSLDIDYRERQAAQDLELDDNLGLSSAEIIRTLSASPNFSMTLSERSRIELLYRYAQTRVQDDAALDNDDSDQHNFRAGWLRTLSPRATFAIYADYVAFRPQNPEIQLDAAADVYGLSLGGSYQFSEKWTIDGTVGANLTEVDDSTENVRGEIPVVEDGDVVFVSSITSNYTGEKDEVRIGVSAGTNQQLDGAIDKQQSFGLGWSRKISEVLTASLDGRYFHAERNDRDNYTFDVALVWRASPRWQYRLRYGYRERTAVLEDQVFEGSEEGVSNRITFTVDYSFEDMRFGI